MSDKKYFKRWYFWATHSRLESIIKAAKMMRRHLDEILGYRCNGCTNALPEGLNVKIQEIKYHARVHRNRENFRMAILFHCDGLDMDPRLKWEEPRREQQNLVSAVKVELFSFAILVARHLCGLSERSERAREEVPIPTSSPYHLLDVLWLPGFLS